MNSLKKQILFLITTSILSLSFSCSNESENSDQIKPEQTERTAEDVKEDFQAIDFKPGINDISLESTTKGFYWNFRVIVPINADVSSDKLPLLFNLHGGAQNVNPDLHKNTDCLITPGLNGVLEAYIISPNSNGELWYTTNNQIQIVALHDLMTTYLPINKERVAVTGYSDGGNGSWFYAQFYDTLFSAAIPLATSYNTISNDGEYKAFKTPLYVIHGEQDELFPLETTQGYIDQSIAVGSDIQFVIAPELNHYQICDYLPYFTEAVSWLITEVWQ